MTDTEFRTLLRALLELRDAVTRAADTTPATRRGLRPLTAEIREESEPLHQFGTPYADLMGACDLIDQADTHRATSLAGTELTAAADTMGRAIGTLRAYTATPSGGAQ
jgi:hypothetical protein